MMDYMMDKDFLKKLDYHKEKQTYVRITALNNDDYPREEIVGRATGGSVNVDGASAVRRSCSLSMVALECDPIITDTFWCYDNKFKLEIGLQNLIDNRYPDIIWFNMGVYIITSFNKNKSTNNLTVSISGKDKMCRLNGEVSGNIMMSTDFGNIEEVNKIEEVDPNTGETKVSYHTTVSKLPIYMIIQNALKEYGQERAENIIINDLDQYGYELWEYRGDEPMYLFIEPPSGDNNGQVINMTFNGDTRVTIAIKNDDGVWEGAEDEDDNPISSTLKEFEAADRKFYSMNTLDKDYNNDATMIKFSEDSYCYVAKIDYGETAGYHQIPLVYNSDLVLGAGETVTSLLDKLKSMLGDFEYFYDLNGRFVFQKKNTYIQELFSPIDGELVTPTLYTSPYSYKFENEELFTAISNSPNINNLKNDFAIWGTRKSATGDDLPIHARYAIDKKPQVYKLPYDRYNQMKDLWYVKEEALIISNEEEFKKNKGNIYKENGEHFLIATEYEENIDYYSLTKYMNYKEDCKLYQQQLNGDFNSYIIEDKELYKKVYNAETLTYDYLLIEENDKAPYYIKEEAGTSYSSSNYDWRELIYQMAVDFYQHNQDSDFLLKVAAANPQFIDGKTGYEQYYSDMQAFWRQLYNPDPSVDDQETYGEFYSADSDDKYWNKQIHLDPNTLNFWIDFLDTEGELGKYSVKKYNRENDFYETNIGTRSKVINESSIKSIYFRETPEVQFVVAPKEVYNDDQMAYMPIWIQDSMEGLFYRSAQGASAVGRANELIYQHTALAEGISLTSIPIYYLQPNTRVYVAGQGDYTLDKITYSLAYNGTMTLSGNKILKQFY